MNSAPANSSGDDAVVAQSFLKELKPSQYDLLNSARRLGVELDGPSGAMIGKVSPFRYNSSNPTNNPNSYDLWVDIVVAGKTNRISNWSAIPQPL